MSPYDLALIIIILESLRRRPFGAHPYGPSYHPVVLRLHGAHPAHHIMGSGELWADKLLAEESGGYGIHIIQMYDIEREWASSQK